MAYWSTAIFDFGLSEEVFWNLTPAQFWALSERKNENTRLADYRAGLIASILFNVNKSKTEPVKSAIDFFHSFDDLKKEQKANAMKPEQINDMMFKMFPQVPQ